MFNEQWTRDEEWPLFSVNNYNPSEGQRSISFYFFKISLIDICGSYEAISTQFSEITSLLKGEWKLGKKMYK